MEVPTVEVREVIKQVSKPEASNAAHVRQDTELGCKGQVAKERCRCLNATDSVRSCRAFCAGSQPVWNGIEAFESI